jgi:uncharacterized protein (DUF2141 family)
VKVSGDTYTAKVPQLSKENAVKYLMYLAATIGLFCAAPLAAAAQSDTCSVVVRVAGFRNEKGVLGVTIFRSADGWPDASEKAISQHDFAIHGDAATAQFTLPVGRYAIAVLHDENQNHKLDKNFVGVPKEGFGFSNNPKVGMSAPGFESSTFEVTCPSTELSINLIYK